MEEDLLFVSLTVENIILALIIDDFGDTRATACDAIVLLVTAATWQPVEPTCGELLPDMSGVVEWRIIWEY